MISSARADAKRRGERFVKRLRWRFGDVGTDSPHFDGIEVREPWVIQRHNGRVVGGAVIRDGERGMIAGGKVVGSPVSARPIYEALNALGVKPSRQLTPYGRDAQEKH